MSDNDNTATNAERQTLRPWKPGTSGNPKGRPRKGLDACGVERLARLHVAQALDVVLTLMCQGESDRVKLDAARAVLALAGGDVPEPDKT
ncbi:DUF5681 domain-containing protein [Sphaerotilus sp.]|uniref:DUF5681 domain-containing protein n=1 Tax=Sphaerotilus sp. TaxID=2093942 RepID=UPI002ACE1617|nr:DUF5681 domain-containing protein [Sphaerotilus sp.]MDZ7858647.1 DUF5681 domain-containing protein [Sphaerotilus sp.]